MSDKKEKCMSDEPVEDERIAELLKGLTPKQTKFVQKYIENGGNGTQAALESYNVNSLKTAQNIGSENLAKPIVSEKLDKWRRILATDANLGMKEVINGLGYVAAENVDEKPSVCVSALSEINKMLGHYKNESEIGDTLKSIRDMAEENRKARKNTYDKK